VATISRFCLVSSPVISTESFFARHCVRRGRRRNAGIEPLQIRFIHVNPPRLKPWVPAPDQTITPWHTDISFSSSPSSRRKAIREREMEELAHATKTVGTRAPFRLQFITTPTSDTPGTTVLLHFDNKRYIFGEITEGTQRACNQRGIGLKKVRGVFMTGKTAWNNGGLLGMILSLADAQAAETESEDSPRRPRLHLYAGPKQLHSLACARRFIFRTGMPLSMKPDPQRARRLGSQFSRMRIFESGLFPHATVPAGAPPQHSRLILMCPMQKRNLLRTTGLRNLESHLNRIFGLKL